jgi:four helix bundle protein
LHRAHAFSGGNADAGLPKAGRAANIAEGCGRAGDRDFRRFLRHSLGSACELEYHLLLARDLGFFSEQTYRPLNSQVVEVKRMLVGLIRRLVTDEPSNS